MHRIMQKVLAKKKITINIITTKVTNQKSFCCCWIFPGLNILREMLEKNLKTSEFEISSNYITFWDKFEKNNYISKNIIELYPGDYEYRTLYHII